MTPRATLFGSIVLLCSTATLVLADVLVPSPTNSSVPACVIACPSGEIVTEITVRDFANNTIAGSTVWLDFSRCPSFIHCLVTGENPTPYVIDAPNHLVRAVTDGSGVVRFPLQMGGGCDHATLSVLADGVPLRQPAFASPDQDGNLVVDATDVTIAQSKLGMLDETADFDCDGTVTQSDVDVVTAHMDHVCRTTTSVRPSSWGRVKFLYR